MINVSDIPIRSYAHIGDAVYEVFAREKTVFLTTKSEFLHKLTVAVVNADFHAYLLEKIELFINDEEKEIIRRARNIPVTTARRNNQKVHRLSTAFEALIGYLYLNNPERLKELFNYITPLIDARLSEFTF